jgi:Flp pilus assembly protein TadB
MTERLFMITTGLLLLTALVLLWRNNLSAAFVIGTLGIVAWFLSYRAQLRAKRPSDPPVEPNEDVKD